jgi:hypothetical protein
VSGHCYDFFVLWGLLSGCFSIFMCSGRVDVGGGVGLWVGGGKAGGGAERSMGVDDDGRLENGGSGGELEATTVEKLQIKEGASGRRGFGYRGKMSFKIRGLKCFLLATKLSTSRSTY